MSTIFLWLTRHPEFSEQYTRAKDAELVMIDENLCRAELSPADRAQYTARRKAIYLEKHPETAREATLKQNDESTRQVGETENVVRFTKETAERTGKSERAIQRDAERGANIAPDVLRSIKGTFLDNGVYLDGLKKLSHDDQRAKVERDVAKRRLADEYDAAQERGELSVKGQHGAHVPDGNMRATVFDAGLTRKQVREARIISDAEKAEPGIVGRRK